jgi:hypothetical protein
VRLAAASSIDVDVNAPTEAGISEVLRWPFASTELAAALAPVCVRPTCYDRNTITHS